MLLETLYYLFKSKKGMASNLNSILLWSTLCVIALLALYIMIRHNANAAESQVGFISQRLGDKLTSRG